MLWHEAWNHLLHDSQTTPRSSHATVLSHVPKGAKVESLICFAGFFRWPDWYGDRLFFQIRVCKDSVQINHCHSSENFANFIHRHRALPTITRIYQWLGGGGGGGGGGDLHTDQNNGSLRVYFVVQIPPFIDWTCSAGEECGATAEITRSLQIDLVLSDAATTSEP